MKFKLTMKNFDLQADKIAYIQVENFAYSGYLVAVMCDGEEIVIGEEILNDDGSKGNE